MFGRKIKNDYGVNINEKKIGAVIDYTNLDPCLTRKQLENFLCVAYKNKYYAICVNPVNVRFCRRYIDYKFKSSVNLCTVVGFPLGANTTETKVFELKDAIKNGADEIDVVAPISKIKEGDWSYIKNELVKLNRAKKKKVLKVIVETALLNKQELEKISILCAKCKVDYVKTSTGYANGGALPEDVEIIRDAVKNRCGIKASGGIRTRQQAVLLVRSGATRIGTSKEI